MRTTTGLCFVFLGMAVAPQAAKAPADVPLAVSYRNADTDGVVSDGLLSLSGLPFQYVNGQPDNVGAILRGGGNFLFIGQYDTSVPARRQICLNFGAQANPWGAVKCAAANENMDPPLDSTTTNTPLSSLHYGDTLRKRLQIWWDDRTVGYRYHVRYGGDMNGDAVADAPGVTVACVAPFDAASPCTAWTVMNDGYTILGRSRLLRGGQLGAFEFIGFYDLPFDATLTIQ